MAGPFTHMLVADAAYMTQGGLPPVLQQVLSTHRNFLFLGSVSPDLPAFYEATLGGYNWAQVFHTEETVAVPIDALVELRAKPPAKQVDAARLAWAFGYVAHVVTDATVHPIINAIVKKAGGRGSVHQDAEMLQDSLLVRERVGRDIQEAELSSRLVACRKKASIYEPVVAFWSDRIRDEYLEPMYGKPHTESWADVYIAGLDAGEPGPGGNGRLVRYLSRHIKGLDRYVYQRADALKNEQPQAVRDYFEAVALPGGGTGSFRTEGFDRSVANLLKVWNQLWTADWNCMALSAILLDWNLDTGCDPEGRMTFWA